MGVLIYLHMFFLATFMNEDKFAVANGPLIKPNVIFDVFA